MKNIPQLNGKVYPDKSFTIGIVPRKKSKSQDRAWIRSLREVIDARTPALADWYVGSTSIGGKFVSMDENIDTKENYCELREISEHDKEIYREMEKVKDSDYSNFYEAEPPSTTPLFIESPKSSRKSRKPYGENGITNYGKKVVRNSAILLEQKYGKHRLGFVTCTLPGVDEVLCKLAIEKWSEICRRFYQKVKRQLQKISQPFIYTGVTEIQENRFKKHGIPAPHLHFVYVCRSSARDVYWLYICQLHRAWNEAIGECLSGVGAAKPWVFGTVLGSVHAKRVQKSASAYLGKYISKGCTVVEAMKDAGYTIFPKQWWTASMQMKKMFKESIIHLPLHTCRALFDNAQLLAEAKIILNYRYVYIELSGIERRVGIAGIMSDDLYDEMLN
jgi:hypothetical protein